MVNDMLETLPMEQRLSLAYASKASRADLLVVFALEQRLADIVRNPSEPVLAQMKLAWWRDQLAKPSQEWPQGEPLLAAMQAMTMPHNLLSGLADAWEHLLLEKLDQAAALNFANGRAQVWRALAMAHAAKYADAAEQAGREWALIDLACNLGTDEEAQFVRKIAQAQDWRRVRLPKPLRGLQILHRLADKCLANNGSALLQGPKSMLTVLRIGLLGR